MRAYLVLLAILTYVLVVASSCSKEGIKSFTDLMPLRKALTEKYNEPDVSVVIQNMNTLGVSFVNSAFNNLEKQEKAKRAQEIAIFIKKSYASIDQIKTIWVAFVIHKSYFIFIQYNNALDTFFFDKNRLLDSGDVEMFDQTFKAGNEALQAKQYDEALKDYDACIAIIPDEPVLFINKSVAFRLRGVEGYNISIKLKDGAERNAGLDAARRDFRSAAGTATKAADLVKSRKVAGGPNEQAQQNATKLLALAARAEAMRLLVTIVDPKQVDTALTAFQEYMAAEGGPAKRSKAQIDAARMLLDTGRWSQAATEYQNILNAEPNNIDAILGLGLSLYQSGDKTKYQEAAKYLRRFVEMATDTHPLKLSAKEALDFMKKPELPRPLIPRNTVGSLQN